METTFWLTLSTVFAHQILLAAMGTPFWLTLSTAIAKVKMIKMNAVKVSFGLQTLIANAKAKSSAAQTWVTIIWLTLSNANAILYSSVAQETPDATIKIVSLLQTVIISVAKVRNILTTKAAHVTAHLHAAKKMVIVTQTIRTVFVILILPAAINSPSLILGELMSNTASVKAWTNAVLAITGWATNYVHAILKMNVVLKTPTIRILSNVSAILKKSAAPNRGINMQQINTVPATPISSVAMGIQNSILTSLTVSASARGTWFAVIFAMEITGPTTRIANAKLTWTKTSAVLRALSGLQTTTEMRPAALPVTLHAAISKRIPLARWFLNASIQVTQLHSNTARKIWLHMVPTATTGC